MLSCLDLDEVIRSDYLCYSATSFDVEHLNLIVTFKKKNHVPRIFFFFFGVPLERPSFTWHYFLLSPRGPALFISLGILFVL